MMDRFSAAGRRALERAHAVARSAHAARLEPAHLLIGLLLDEESQASALLRRHFVDPEQVLEALNPPVSISMEGGEPYLPDGICGRILQRAAEWTDGEEAVGSEELLLSTLEFWQPAEGVLSTNGQIARQIVETAKLARANEPLAVAPADQPVVDVQAEEADLYRILDANANRLREALRVVEEYARFVLGDRRLSQSLKDCRQDLRAALADFPTAQLVRARDVAGDVGTTNTTASEYARAGLLDVAIANCKRAQEAARALEEYSKTCHANAARRLEQLRYRLYSIEQRLAIGQDDHRRNRLRDAKLYWLADPDRCVASLDWTLAEAVAGGVDVVQLRDKSGSDREVHELARRMRQWTLDLGVLFIVNDRPDIARLVGADGVHVGQEELSLPLARRILGTDAIIGVSTHDVNQLEEAARVGADYVGIGPVFPSATKKFAEFPGLEFVRQSIAFPSIPKFCIGGISLENATEVVRAGADRLAVSHAIGAAKEPRAAASALWAALQARTV